MLLELIIEKIVVIDRYWLSAVIGNLQEQIFFNRHLSNTISLKFFLVLVIMGFEPELLLHGDKFIDKTLFFVLKESLNTVDVR